MALRRALALALAALAMSAPSASARVVVSDAPRDLSVLHPLEDDASIATLLKGHVGRYWWSNGSFQPLVDLAPFTRHAVSPDLEWVVLRRLVETGDPDAPFNDTVRAVNATTGEERALRSGEMRALAAGGGRVAVTTASNASIWVWRWGAWDEPMPLFANVTAEHERRARALGANDSMSFSVSPPFDASRVRHMAISADGAWLAAADDARVLVFSLASGELATPDAIPLGRDPLVGVTFSPDATHLALLTSQEGRFSELRVARAPPCGCPDLAVRRWGEAALGLAWGPTGLALVQASHAEPYAQATSILVRFYADPPRLKDERQWGASPARATGALAFVDDRLFVERDGAIHVLANGVTPVLASTPGHAPAFAQPLTPPVKTLPTPPTDEPTPPTDEPTPEATPEPERDAVAAAWPALALLGVAAAARLVARRR